MSGLAKRMTLTLEIVASPLVVGLLFTYQIIHIDWISFMEIQQSFRAMEDPLPLPANSVPIEGPAYVPGAGSAANPIPADLGDQRPAKGNGVHAKRPHLSGATGVHRMMPSMCSGMGVHRKTPKTGAGGVHAEMLEVGAGLKGERLREYMRWLALRLRDVRVCCGDWDRIMGPSPTWSEQGVTGVFLDPPYSMEADRAEVYASEDLTVSHKVREWAIENGDNKLLRIALCGYEGEHKMPDSWECVEWKAHGGYGSQGKGRGRENRHRERIWLSPHCKRIGSVTFAYSLFD